MRLAVISRPLEGAPIFWRNVGPPLESALADLPDATLVVPPGLRRPSLRSAAPAWLNAIKTVRRADTVFWIQMHLHPGAASWGLAYARPTARRAALAIDSWEPSIQHLGRVLEAQHLTRCFLAYNQAYAALKDAFPKLPLEWMPLGVPLGVFHDLGLERDIDVYWMGRRSEGLHQALVEHCARRGLVYRYAQHPNDPPTQVELNELMSRARYFVVLPPTYENAARTGAFTPLTSRYLEGPAAGARLLGVIPPRVEYEWFYPPNAIVECAPDGSDIGSVLDRADADPEWEATRVRVRDHVRAQHGWENRASAIYSSLKEAE